jgi:hypothetical protein
VEGKYGRADIIWWVLELACHGVRHSERGSGCPATHDGFVLFGDGYEWMGWATSSCENRPAIVMPVDYEVGVPHKADHHRDEERRNGGRVLFRILISGS